MFEDEIEELKELIYGLEEELQDENYDEADASIDFIIAICNSVRLKIKE